MLRQWRSGVIEVRSGELTMIRRRWGRGISFARAKLEGAYWHRWRRGDRCRLYYFQPYRIRDFLTLAFIASTRDAGLRTFRRATLVLDEIAEIKGSWAIVCHAMNPRISDRLLARWGWERHCAGQRGRHFIKRIGEPFRWCEDDTDSRADQPQRQYVSG